MLKLKDRKTAIVTLILCIMLCVGAAISIKFNKKPVTASADTRAYSVTETYSANVSQTTPVAIRLIGLTEGQYSIFAEIIEVDGLPTEFQRPYHLFATVNGESFELNYFGRNHTFNGVIRVCDEDTLILTTTTSSTLTLSITISSLTISERNDYILPNVQIPANEGININLNNFSGKYNMLVDLGTERLEKGAVIYVEIGDTVVELSKDDFYYSAYFGKLDLGLGVENITIFNANPVCLDATIMLNQELTYDDLPSFVDLTIWEKQGYKYTATDTGYFSLNTSSDDFRAQVSITFKTSPDDFEGVPITENNFPIYMEAGDTYYFEFVLIDYSNDTSAIINTSVEEWVKPTIMTDISYPVPVTAAGRDKVTMDLVAEEGEYNLSLMEVPYNWYWEDITVTAYIGGEVIALTPANNYATEIFLDGNTRISLTTNSEDSTALMLYIVTPEEVNYITLDKAMHVTVPDATYDEIVPGNAIYYLENAQVGYYGITLSENNNISVDANWLPAVFKGDTVGGFRVTESGDVAIEFYNYNMEATSFTATVTKLDGNYDMALGMNEVSINKGATVYYLEGLAVGNYDLTITGLPAGATVSIDGVAITLDGGKATFIVSEDQDNRGLVTVMFMSDAEAYIIVTITPLNIMMFNEAMTITTEFEYHYRTAYYIYLEAGIYAFQLSTPEKLYVLITANNEMVAPYGAEMGVITVTESGLVALRFRCFTYGAENTFKAIVTNVAGTMTFGKEEAITLPAYEFGKVYTMYGLAYGEYNVTVSADVKVYVNGFLLESNTFYLYDDACTIAFVSDVAVTFTAKVTPANMLKLGEKTEITITAWKYSTTYFMELEEGEYTIELTLSDGTMIQVSVDGETYLEFGETTGSVYVEGGYVAFTFETNTFEEVTFSVLVKAVE